MKLYNKLSIFMVFCFVILSWAVHAGNKELLDNWAQRKEQIVKNILGKLRKEGKLPQNGVVKFTAKVKPVDEQSLDVQFKSLEIIPRAVSHQPIDSITIHSNKTFPSHPIKNQKAMKKIFKPRNPGDVYTKGEIVIQGGKVHTKQVELLNGLTGGGKAEEPDENYPAKTEEDVHPGWWQQFLHHIKVK